MTFQNVSVTPLPSNSAKHSTDSSGRAKANSIDLAPSTEIDAVSAAMLIQSLKESSEPAPQEPTSSSSSIIPPPPPQQAPLPKSPSAGNRTKSFDEKDEVEPTQTVENVNPIHALQSKPKPPPTATEEDNTTDPSDPSQQGNANKRVGRAGRGAGRKPPPPKPGASEEVAAPSEVEGENQDEATEGSPKQGQEKRRSVNMKRVAGSRAHSIRQSVTESPLVSVSIEEIDTNSKTEVESTSNIADERSVSVTPPIPSPSSPTTSKPEILIKPVAIDAPIFQPAPIQLSEVTIEQTPNRVTSMSMDSNDDGLNADTSPTSSNKKSNLKGRDREHSTSSGRVSLRVSFAEEAEDSAGGRKKVHSFEVEEPNSDKERLLGEKKKGCLDSCTIS
jgi:hypothetical protein